MQKLNPFGGVEKLYSPEALQLFAKSRIAIVGLGGVGSWAVEALARSGIGNLILMDLDTVCESNINRQIHSTYESLGKSKVQALKERITTINPQCETLAIEDFFTAQNREELFQWSPDFVIDAIDGVSSKCHLINECRSRRIPLITTGAAGGIRDPHQILLRDLNFVIEDPLLYRVRKKLRRDFNYPKFRRQKWKVPALFSSQTRIGNNEEESSDKSKCDGFLGSSVAVTGVFGFMAASFVMNKLYEKSLT